MLENQSQIESQSQIPLNLLQKINLKKAEATGDLIGNKFANETTIASKTLRQNTSETGESDKEY